MADHEADRRAPTPRLSPKGRRAWEQLIAVARRQEPAFQFDSDLSSEFVLVSAPPDPPPFAHTSSHQPFYKDDRDDDWHVDEDTFGLRLPATPFYGGRLGVLEQDFFRDPARPAWLQPHEDIPPIAVWVDQTSYGPIYTTKRPKHGLHGHKTVSVLSAHRGKTPVGVAPDARLLLAAVGPMEGRRTDLWSSDDLLVQTCATLMRSLRPGDSMLISLQAEVQGTDGAVLNLPPTANASMRALCRLIWAAGIHVVVPSGNGVRGNVIWRERTFNTGKLELGDVLDDHETAGWTMVGGAAPSSDSAWEPPTCGVGRHVHVFARSSRVHVAVPHIRRGNATDGFTGTSASSAQILGAAHRLQAGRVQFHPRLAPYGPGQIRQLLATSPTEESRKIRGIGVIPDITTIAAQQNHAPQPLLARTCWSESPVGAPHWGCLPNETSLSIRRPAACSDQPPTSCTARVYALPPATRHRIRELPIGTHTRLSEDVLALPDTPSHMDRFIMAWTGEPPSWLDGSDEWLAERGLSWGDADLHTHATVRVDEDQVEFTLAVVAPRATGSVTWSLDVPASLACDIEWEGLSGVYADGAPSPTANGRLALRWRAMASKDEDLDGEATIRVRRPRGCAINKAMVILTQTDRLGTSWHHWHLTWAG